MLHYCTSNRLIIITKVVTNLDKRWGLWQKEEEENGGSNGAAAAAAGLQQTDDMIGMGSTNPVLDNITDYLIEEVTLSAKLLMLSAMVSPPKCRTYNHCLSRFLDSFP